MSLIKNLSWGGGHEYNEFVATIQEKAHIKMSSQELISMLRDFSSNQIFAKNKILTLEQLENFIITKIAMRPITTTISRKDDEYAWACEVLSISNDDSFDDAKKAYKTLANLKHPDKLSILGSEAKKYEKDAHQNLLMLNDAIAIIKKYK